MEHSSLKLRDMSVIMKPEKWDKVPQGTGSLFSESKHRTSLALHLIRPLWCYVNDTCTTNQYNPYIYGLNLLILFTMSVVQNPIIGRASGKFSTAIFQKWKDKNVLRSKPLTVANPNSPAQQMRRNMFAYAVDFARLISPVVIIGFNGFKSTLTWMNMFVKKANTGWLVPGAAPLFTIDWVALITSQGPMTPTHIASIVATNASVSVNVTWPTTLAAPDQASTDIPCIVAYNEDQQQIGYYVGSPAIIRAIGGATFSMSGNNLTGDTLHVYLFFQRADGTMVSSNTYYAITV